MSKYEQRKNPRTASYPGAIRGLFYYLSKFNRYLRAILQGINQAVIAHDGNFIDHSVPELFVEFDGRSFKLGQFKEHTDDGNRLGISFLTLCLETFDAEVHLPLI